MNWNGLELPPAYYQDDAVYIIHGDCREKLANLKSIFSAVPTDPPYELGFMGKSWDSQGVSFQKETWEIIRKSCLPGAPLLSFGGTRTQHRIACAIEDGGWEIRDCLIWCYGSGFPKSLSIGKAIDKVKGAEREVIGKYKHPRSVEQGKAIDNSWGNESLDNTLENYVTQGDDKRTLKERLEITAPITPEAKLWEGYGTALKPAYEPIILAMNPLDGTFANNALKYGVAGLNIDGCRVGMTQDDVNSRRSRNGESVAKLTIFGNESGTINFANAINTQGRFPANFLLGYPEDEYETKNGISQEQLKEVEGWLNAHPEL